MGEPLNNYVDVVEAVRIMTGLPFQLSSKRITVSTVGILHAIKKLHNYLPGLNLAVYLHAPVQDVHCQIMPAARAFPLEKLMDALQEYQKNRTSGEEEVSIFQKILRGTYNIRTTIRKEMGQDISGACGQLVVNLPDKSFIGNVHILKRRSMRYVVIGLHLSLNSLERSVPMAILRGIEFAVEVGLVPFVVESNSLGVINMINSGAPNLSDMGLICNDVCRRIYEGLVAGVHFVKRGCERSHRHSRQIGFEY
ncbi:hypothetical protein Q3G72_026297 [Acer saccharum]|nr:hypothetical protein Q3G72_026297 [Acer saccharum]